MGILVKRLGKECGLNIDRYLNGGLRFYQKLGLEIYSSSEVTTDKENGWIEAKEYHCIVIGDNTLFIIVRKRRLLDVIIIITNHNGSLRGKLTA